MNRVKLKDIAEINPRKSEIDKDSVDRVSFVAMADVSENGFIANHESVPLSDVYSSYTYFKKGDVLLAKITPCFENGKAAIVDDIPNEIGFGSTEFHVLRTNGKALPKYVFYVLWNDDFRLTGSKKMTGSAGQKRVPTKFLKNYEIPLPTLDEQKAIVAKLDRAQRLIDIDKEMLTKYDELIQSVFLEMFGDPVTNPKGLQEKEFGDLVDITGGYAFKSKNFIDDDNGVKVVKIANVHFIDLDWSEVQYLPKESIDDHEKYSLREGDILLALTRPIINSLDAVKAVVVKKADLPALLNQRVARIRVDSDEVTEDYITSFIYTQHFKRQIEKYASTSLQPNVSNKEVSKIKVLVPSIERQREFSDVRQRILNERIALGKTQQKSEELFSSLVQEAFQMRE